MSSAGGTVVKMPPATSAVTAGAMSSSSAVMNATSTSAEPTSNAEKNRAHETKPTVNVNEKKELSKTSEGVTKKNAVDANIERRNFKRDERKRELLLEARKSRIEWILRGSDDSVNNGNGKNKHEIWDGKRNPLRDLHACGAEMLSCAPDVIQTLLTSRIDGANGGGNDCDFRIASSVKRILEEENLSWEFVSSHSKTENGESQTTKTLSNEQKDKDSNSEQHELLNLPITPLSTSYHQFLQTLCEPPAADVVLSIQKFCKTVQEAAQVMKSVQEDHAQKQKIKEQQEKSEHEKKSFQLQQHPLVKSSKKSGSDDKEQKEEKNSSDPSTATSKSVSSSNAAANTGAGPSSSLSPQNFNHAASLAKALRGFLNSTIREMEAHPSFQNFLYPGENLSVNTDYSADGKMSNMAKEELLASFEKFLYIKCHEAIDMVLEGEVDSGDDDYHVTLHHGDASHVSEHNALHGDSKPARGAAKTIHESDLELYDKMLSLQFVTPNHLEIDCLKHSSNVGSSDDDNVIDLSYSIQKLRSIHDQSSPRQKLQCILLAHRGISVALNAAVGQNSKGEFLPTHLPPSNQDHNPPGADDVLPTLILAVLRSHPPSLLNDLRFIEHFAPPTLLRGESGYAYTNLCGAVHFLKKLDIDGHLADVSLGGLGEGAVLSIGPDDFRAGLERCRMAMKFEEEKKTAAEDVVESNATNDEDPNDSSSDEKFNSSECIESLMALKMKISPREIRDARSNGEIVDIDWAFRKQADLLQRHGKIVSLTTEESVNTTNVLSSQQQQQQKQQQHQHHLPPEDPPLPSKFSRSYSFLAVRPNDIRMSDLPQLLKEYQMLVHATESLLNERTAWRKAEQKRQIELERESLERSYYENVMDGGTDDTTTLELMNNGRGKKNNKKK